MFVVDNIRYFVKAIEEWFKRPNCEKCPRFCDCVKCFPPENLNTEVKKYVKKTKENIKKSDDKKIKEDSIKDESHKDC
jgi:hypothetical protein|tara:strand:- start:785 stop:1018 length:234 start_codon:yes stop_codon:yes gene_type:complete